jgi:hypothetical protein
VKLLPFGTLDGTPHGTLLSTASGTLSGTLVGTLLSTLSARFLARCLCQFESTETPTLHRAENLTARHGRQRGGYDGTAARPT